MFFDIIIITLSFAASLAIIVPLSGVLVRFRANFNPRGLQLDADGNVQPHTGPVISSYFGMMARVYRIEGVSGLYKGLMPNMLMTILVGVFVLIFFDSMVTHPGAAPTTTLLGTLVFSLFQMIVSLPAVVITYRAIVTPHKLPYFQPMYSLRVLLTPTERRQPWKLYLTPGLLAAQTLHITYSVVGLRILRNILIPGLANGPLAAEAKDVSGFWLGIYFLVVIASAGILAPLEVMATRLAIQRNHSSAQYNSVSQEEEGDAEIGAEFAGIEEDVIGLRNERDPYLGLFDCYRRMKAEEGKRALYRAWWLTMFGGLATAFA